MKQLFRTKQMYNFASLNKQTNTMKLEVTFSIEKDGLIQYDPHLTMHDTPLGEIGKLQLDTLNKMHEAILVALEFVNNGLKTDGTTKILFDKG